MRPNPPFNSLADNLFRNQKSSIQLSNRNYRGGINGGRGCPFESGPGELSIVSRQSSGKGSRSLPKSGQPRKVRGSPYTSAKFATCFRWYRLRSAPGRRIIAGMIILRPEEYKCDWPGCEDKKYHYHLSQINEPNYWILPDANSVEI